MKIGVIVDGRSEVVSFPKLRPSLEKATGHQFLNPVQIRMDPQAPILRLAAACESEARALTRRDADLAIVIIDRESRDECPPQIALELSQAIQSRGNLSISVEVVVKNRTFENWVIADPQAIVLRPGRFGHQRCVSLASTVRTRGADELDAIDLLNQAVLKMPYCKIEDSRDILERADISIMARNSRSFRRFLRCVDHPNYRDQSRVPR